MAWLKLVRWSNLLIILLTQGLVWACIVLPLGEWHLLLLGPFHFACLCLSTILIAAAGYLINDYFDIRIDAINKPQEVILDRQIPRRLAMLVHLGLNVLALMLAGIVALPAGHPEWLLLQLGCALLLWRYSTTWKRQFAIGNVIVALMTALTIGAVALYEPAVWRYIHQPALRFTPDWMYGQIHANPLLAMAIYAFFAFALTWMREVVKDMEDFKGDEADGCVTMPIRWGLLRSSRFVQAIGFAVIGVLIPVCISIIRLSSFLPSVLAIYVALFIVLPLLIWIFYLPRKATVAHYAMESFQLKVIMVAGILSLPLYYFLYG